MWKDVMHNLLYFLYELLPAAASRTSWNQDSLDKAMCWGAYCEKISRQFMFNHTMQSAFSYLARQSQWALTFYDLQSARQLILRILMQNQLLDPCVKEYIQCMADRALGPAITSTLYQQALQQKYSCKQLINALTDMKCEEVKRRFEARLMLEASSSSDQGHLQDCHTKLVMLPEGLVMILSAVRLDNEADGDKNALVGPTTVKWLEGVLTSQDSTHRRVVRTLCTVNPLLLSEILGNNLNLLGLLMSVLDREAKKLEPFYHNERCCWLPQDPTASILSYHDLVYMYTTLLKVEVISVHAQKKVYSFCLQDGGSVWSDVIRDVNAEKKA